MRIRQSFFPVMYNPTGAELAAAKKQHRRILKAPTKNQAFLDADR